MQESCGAGPWRMGTAQILEGRFATSALECVSTCLAPRDTLFLDEFQRELQTAPP